jgi:hypothetical protein
MSEPKSISMDELFKELEQLRKTRQGAILTDEQKRFLERGRTGQKIVSFGNLALLWRKKWPKVSEGFLRDQWQKMKNDSNP